MSKEHRMPSSRLARFAKMGRLAGGLAGGAIGEGTRQLAQGKRPRLDQLLLTPANARRLGDRLSEMRGAAMKLGQIISMDGGNVLPPELSEALARLRDKAHYMPLGQVAQVLETAWGKDWDRAFERFIFTPLAAASIGQVHDALLRDGRRIAVKVQYPGVRRSIDSDVDNMATLLRLTHALPDGFDIAPLLEEAKQQLHEEADYLLEARHIERYATLLGDDPRFELPLPLPERTTAEVLCMRFLDGQPIESLEHLPATERTELANTLFELALREVFVWGVVQSDPNFANYRYNPVNGALQLLDFGATRLYAPDRRDALRALLLAAIDGSDAAVARTAVQVGYLADEDSAHYRDAFVRLLRLAAEPARAAEPFAFSGSDLPQRMREVLVQLRVRDKFHRIPPTDVLYLHRKISGLYLLLSRLKVRLPVGEIVRHTLTAPPGRPAD
ncbi:ABC1 kinase family protein [Acidihalobacter ferrooxydans]|uniref:Ubiquinol-cytochrome C reductase n=1 Tax=Acidihalobacter ferrooxydans TaxID=1765967 RepID=A0A1P8UG98_9GAMM|nr:AarF/ABC1/UbiB kinase family protein [Acidihalobacter ferrooxydans]APZ42845.1 ubiquinol-cytochrome C reductase [Acidihalobacter ferrooxydans]